MRLSCFESVHLYKDHFVTIDLRWICSSICICLFRFDESVYLEKDESVI